MVQVKLKFPLHIRSTLIVLSVASLATEDTLEPCHLHLVLSTCPTIMFLFCLVTARAIGHVDNTRWRWQGSKVPFVKILREYTTNMILL